MASEDLLDRLVGEWTFTMRHVAMDEDVTGHQRYERVLDGAFLLQHWTYDHPDFPDAMSLLSADRCHYFDVRGVTRTFELTTTDDSWTILRIDDDFSQRTTTTFVTPDRTTSEGEASHDRGATWQPDFSVQAIRG